MENISLEFLLERKSIIKASKDKAKEEMASKGADRKAAAADKASANSDELSKWGKAVWDIISKLNHGAIVKDTFNQSAADGTLQAAAEKGLLDDKKGNQKNEGVTYEDFIMQESSRQKQMKAERELDYIHRQSKRYADQAHKYSKEYNKAKQKNLPKKANAAAKKAGYFSKKARELRANAMRYVPIGSKTYSKEADPTRMKSKFHRDMESRKGRLEILKRSVD